MIVTSSKHQHPSFGKTLILMTGLPGTGKSTIASAIAESLAIPLVSADPIEATLHRYGMRRDDRSGELCYALIESYVTQALSVGVSTIIDSVNAHLELRQRWYRLAKKYDTRPLLIECRCSDLVIHEKRINTRSRNIEGFAYEPTWSDVVERMPEFDPVLEPRLELDALSPVDTNIAKAVEYVVSQ